MLLEEPVKAWEECKDVANPVYRSPARRKRLAANKGKGKAANSSDTNKRIPARFRFRGDTGWADVFRIAFFDEWHRLRNTRTQTH